MTKTVFRLKRRLTAFPFMLPGVAGVILRGAVTDGAASASIYGSARQLEARHIASIRPPRRAESR